MIFAADLPELPQRAVQNAHEHVGRLLLLVLRHGGFEILRERGQAAGRLNHRLAGFGIVGNFTRKNIQRARGGYQELIFQLGSRVWRQRRGDVLGCGLLTIFRVEQGSAEPHPAVDGIIAVGRYAQIFVTRVERTALPGEEHLFAIELNRQHVVEILVRLTRSIANLVDHCGADVLQMPLTRRSHRCAQVPIEAGHEGLLLGFDAGHLRRAHVLHVEDSQFGELDLHALRPIAELAIRAHGAGQIEGLIAGAVHRPGLEEQFRSAIGEARLENGDAVIRQRMVDLDLRRKALARAGIGDHHITGEQARHAGGIEVDVEFFQMDVERQRLQQHAVAHAEHRHIRFAAIGNLQIAAKGRVVHRQLVDLGHLRQQHIGLERLFAEHPHLRLDHHVAIEQRTYADQHECGMRQHITNAVDASGLRSDHGGARTALLRRRTLLHLELVAVALHDARQMRHGGRAAIGERGFAALVEVAHALLAHPLFIGLQIGDDLGRIADQAQAGGHHQKGQDQQEPPGGIDVIQLELAEHFRPERPELVDVIVVGLSLGEHRADDAGDGDDHQQRNGKTHRRKQFDKSAPGA